MYADKRRKYTVEEKMVLQYGTELLLDSVIKIILYIVLGGIIGETKETLFALLTWCVIRKQTGGRHVKNNFVCFVISGSVIFSSVMIGSVLNITLKMLAISVIILNLIYRAYAPYDEYFNEKERTHERQIYYMSKYIFVIRIFLRKEIFEYRNNYIIRTRNINCA